jgi:hypothetical protein
MPCGDGHTNVNTDIDHISILTSTSYEKVPQTNRPLLLKGTHFFCIKLGNIFVDVSEFSFYTMRIHFNLFPQYLERNPMFALYCLVPPSDSPDTK